MYIPVLYVFVCALAWPSQALDNGLALTPPMGWLSWLRFGCTTDCQRKPTECISERLIKRTADSIASEGYLAAGYQYVIIDDCWAEKRDKNGRLVADRVRFPSGIKALSRYVKSKGLKFGMYHWGSSHHETIDAATFAEWEVDYVKHNSGGSPDFERSIYSTFGKLLNESGRPMVYACSWPFYKTAPNYSPVAKECNTWRNYGNIENNWQSIVNIMTWIGNKQDDFAQFAGPGHFNDPDMLIIGNSGLTVDQARVQMAVWSVLAAPLIMSVDLSTIKPDFKKILLNTDVIAVNQDQLGMQGRRIWSDNNNDIWHRELSEDARALAFVNRGSNVSDASYTFDQMKLPKKDYIVKDLFNEEEVRTLKATEDFKVKINPTGVKFYKFEDDIYAYIGRY